MRLEEGGGEGHGGVEKRQAYSKLANSANFQPSIIISQPMINVNLLSSTIVFCCWLLAVGLYMMHVARYCHFFYHNRHFGSGADRGQMGSRGGRLGGERRRKREVRADVEKREGKGGEKQGQQVSRRGGEDEREDDEVSR